MRVIVCHPGHGHSTSDVYDGLCVGLRLCGVDVLPFEWDKPLRIMSAILTGALAAGTIPTEKAEHFRQFTSWLAAADVIGVALDQDVDAAIVVNGTLFPATRALLLQKLSIPVACYGTEAPYFLRMEQEIAQYYTHWFTNERKCVGSFGDVPQFYLPHAYNPELHTPGPPDDDKRVDAVFIGGGYPERKALIEGARERGISIEAYGTLWHLDLNAERGASDIARASRYSENVVPNTETAAWHRSAKVALNIHRKMMQVETGREIAPGSAESLGPRAYEIPAVGGFMLCDDDRPELREVYGDSAATFRAWDANDLARQARYWLTHDDARERQADAQYMAVQPHHWGNRATTLLETIFA